MIDKTQDALEALAIIDRLLPGYQTAKDILRAALSQPTYNPDTHILVAKTSIKREAAPYRPDETEDEMKFTHAKPGMIAVGGNGWKQPIDEIAGGHIFAGGATFCAQTGRYFFDSDETSPFDIISIEPAPEPLRVEGWVNVYEDCFSSVWKTQDAAGHDGADMGRIDFRHIAYIEGEGIVDITDQDDGIKYNRNDLQGGITEREK